MIDNEYGFTLEDLEAYVLEKVASGEMELKDAYSLQNKIMIAARQGYSNRSDKESTLPNYELGSLAYRYLLDNKCTAEEALKYSMEQQGKDEEWLQEVKHKSTYIKHSKQIVEEHEDHPVQKQMVENKVFDKAYMANTQRVNRLISKLAECKSINTRIETLEEISKLQQEQLERVRVESALNNVKMKYMEEVNMLKTMKPKDAARELWKRGCSQKYVAELTGKGMRTIQRWWKEFKQE